MVVGSVAGSGIGISHSDFPNLYGQNVPVLFNKDRTCQVELCCYHLRLQSMDNIVLAKALLHARLGLSSVRLFCSATGP